MTETYLAATRFMVNPASKISYNSPEGRQILLNAVANDNILPFRPHDFSIEVAAQFLDQQDILVRTACGSGKTGTIALIAVLLAQLKDKPELSQHFDVWYPDNAAIVICPTDALEVDIVSPSFILMKNDIKLTCYCYQTGRSQR
jgi:ATP-dependent helicase YprA (DUF1998 family)